MVSDVLKLMSGTLYLFLFAFRDAGTNGYRAHSNSSETAWTSSAPRACWRHVSEHPSACSYPAGKGQGDSTVISWTKKEKTYGRRVLFTGEKVRRCSYQAAFHLKGLDLDSLHGLVQELFLFILGRLLRGRLRQRNKSGALR